MYAASVFFLFVAVASLATGFFQSGLTFVYVSIGASLVAGLFLLLGVLRKRSIIVATAGAPFEPPPWVGQPPAEPARRSEPPPGARPAARPARPAAPVPVRPVPAPGPARAAPSPKRETAPVRRKPSTRKTRSPAAEQARPKKASHSRRPAPKKAAARKPAAARAGRGGSIAPGGRVIVTERGTYHRPSCRMVKGKEDLESATRKAAEADGYAPCRVCKPSGEAPGS